MIARELRLDLYRVDLAGLVSKYIGETEKNLRRLFDAAAVHCGSDAKSNAWRGSGASARVRGRLDSRR